MRGASWPLRFGIVLTVVGVALVLGAMVANSSTPLGLGRAALVALGIAAAPWALLAALRAPLIFPFGAYVAMIPFDQLLRLQGSGATVTRIVGLAAGAALILRMVVTHRMLAPGNAWKAWAAVLAWMAASLLWSLSLSDSTRTLSTMLELFAMYSLLAIYPVEAREFRFLLNWIVVCAVATAALGMNNYLHGARSQQNRVLLVNSSGTEMDANQYGAQFILPFALALVGLLFAKGRLTALGWAAVLGILVVGILVSGSRGALVSLVVAFLYAAVRSRRIWLASSMLALLLPLAWVFPSAWMRFADPSQGGGSGRLDIWAVGRLALREHWFAGVGVGAFPEIYDRTLLRTFQQVFAGWGRPGHDLLLQLSVELGIVGLGLVLFAWFTTGREPRRIDRGSDLFPWRVGAEAALVGLFIAALFVDMLWYKYLWLALSFATVLANRARLQAFERRRGATAEGPHPVVGASSRRMAMGR